MIICRNCVQPNTRPSIVFDKEGICPACRFAEKNHLIDWDQRLAELKQVLSVTKIRNRSEYDCVLGVSGGKDSVRLAMFAKQELKLNVLLVNCSGAPEQITNLGAENLSALINQGFDLITINPGPQTWKYLMRESFLKFGNIHKAAEMALYASSPKVAVSYGIPLVFIGENPAITLGELGTGSISGDASKMRHSNTIASGPDVYKDHHIHDQSLIWYQYPTENETDRLDLKILYLGYYIKDFTKISNAQFAMKYGMKVRTDTPENMGDLTGHEALDDNFALVNQMLKFFKLGFGKVTDQVCEEIRLGRMGRGEAIELVKKYDGKCAQKYVLGFCDYIGISEEEFWKVANQFRNKDIWKFNSQSEWELKERCF